MEAEEKLRALNETLEEKVKEETADLAKEIGERKKAEEHLKEQFDVINRINKMMIGRELRMEDMKKENRRLKDEIQKSKIQSLEKIEA